MHQMGFSIEAWLFHNISYIVGVHTIGASHCSSIKDQLYNHTVVGDLDLSLDKKYVPALKMKCKPNNATTLAEMDPDSLLTFDLGSCKDVDLQEERLFTSDNALLLDTMLGVT